MMLKIFLELAIIKNNNYSLKLFNLLFLISSFFIIGEGLGKEKKNSNNIIFNQREKINFQIASKKIMWNLLNKDTYQKQNTFWKVYEKNDSFHNLKVLNNKNYYSKINSLNRSIIFNDHIVGPDISWLVPPGLAWNNKYKFDGSIRGHNRRQKNEPFLGWNGGDAVGQLYYHPFHKNKLSYGLNLGMRSVYEGSNAGGSTSVGEGLSAGFRIDYEISENSGIAFGAEQLLHFDGLTDTGRDIYLTISKGFWNKKIDGINTFPLHVATAGLGTGKMAEGNVKGLCSDLFGGSGTEVKHQRSLCWAPIFSLARIYNPNFSTFFEYNSKWFLIGSSFSPFEQIPLRGTFALQISDHIENYKVNNFNELKWVFRVSLGI